MCVKLAALTTRSPPKVFARPRTATRPPRALPLPHAAPMHARRLRDAFPSSSRPVPRRRPSPAPAQRHARPEHFRSPTQRRCTPADCEMQSRPTSQPVPRRRPSPPRSATRPSRTLPLLHAAPMHARRLRDAFLADLTTPSPPKAFARTRTATRSPSVPLRAQKKRHRTASVRCRMSRSTVVRSVIWVGEPHAVRRRCGALACRRGA